MLDIDGENIANTLPLHSTAGRKSPDLRLMPVKTQKVSAFNFSPEFEIHPSEREKSEFNSICITWAKGSVGSDIVAASRSDVEIHC